MLQAGRRLKKCKLATHRVNELVKNCWRGDPLERPTPDEVLSTLSLYNTQYDPARYDSRTRLDSGVSSCEGYLDMTCTTDSVGGTSTRAGEAFRYLAPDGINYEHPSQQKPRASYWTNYKIINGAPAPVDAEQIAEDG